MAAVMKPRVGNGNINREIKIELDDEGEPINQNPSERSDDDICELEHLRKLFIGGLASYTTEETLKDFYSKWGNVVDVVVMRDQETKRSRGFGFITYSRASMVDKAQDNRPHEIDGKTVEAKRALPRPERESRDVNISVKKLFVGGLKDNHDEACLHEYFSQFGEVVSVKILTDRTTGKRRGFAFIEFDDYDAVDKAILQKVHSIKYVVVDVKKSVYQEQKRQQNQKNQQEQQQNGKPAMYNKDIKFKPPGGGIPNGPPPPNYHPPPPQMPPYQQPPPMHGGPPPPPPQSYNYWGPPPPPMPPQQYGGYQQPPPQMNNWGYPQMPPNGWNAGPPPPPAGPPPGAWQPPNQWGYPPPPTGGPPQPNPPPGVGLPPVGNWNAPPMPAAPVPPPPGAAVAPQQQVPPPNFGSGYQQNYGGGPTKHQTPNANRMNPYNAQPNNGYAHNPQQNYGGYKKAPPVQAKPPAPPGTSGPPNGAVSGLPNQNNKFRR